MFCIKGKHNNYFGDGIVEKLKLFILDAFTVMIIISVVSVAGLIDITTEQSSEDLPIAKEMAIQLEKSNNDIKNMGNKIAKESKELEELKEQIDSMKDNENPGNWNNVVISYNSKLLQYEKDMKEYNKKLEENNEVYKRYKLLGEKDETIITWVRKLIGI